MYKLRRESLFFTCYITGKYKRNEIKIIGKYKRIQWDLVTKIQKSIMI